MNTAKNPLRKAAILLASIDRKSANALLAQMPPAQAARTRQAVKDLGKVAPQERDAVIREFLRVGPMVPKEEHTGIELDGSLAARLAGSDAQKAQRTAGPPVAAPPPFRFLHETTGEMLAPLLQRENPQAVAVVLSHLPAERAADVLARLPAKQQTEVIHRVVHLDQTDLEIVREIEEELDSLLSEQLHTVRRHTAGLAAMHDILAAADQGDRKEILANLAGHDDSLAKELGYRCRSAGTRTSAKGMHRGRPADAVAKGTFGKRRDEESGPAADGRNPPRRDGTEPAAHSLPRSEPAPPRAAAEPAEFEFDDLAQLDDNALGLVLQAAGPELTVLALTGAEGDLIDRVLGHLPSRRARQLRTRIEQSGPLRVSDVQRAQEELAQLAVQLAARGEIRMGRPQRRLAAVA